MREVTILGPDRADPLLFDIMELPDDFERLLRVRAGVVRLSHWDALLADPPGRHTAATPGPAEVLWHLSGGTIDFEACAAAAAVLAAARPQGAGCGCE
jgi:hypothetical protein